MRRSDFAPATGAIGLVLAMWAGGLAFGGAACQPQWDHAIGQPGFDGWINALAVYDDGTGPALYAGGQFTTAGGQPASRVAKWDGTQWSGLGLGVNGVVYALAVYDAGDGPELYVGGDFTSAGGETAWRIARWNGTRWSTVGTGATAMVLALTVFDPGTGPALYAGGLFQAIGGILGRGLGRWNGTQWSTVGGGVSGFTSGVHALSVFDDGAGPALYVGGDFNTVDIFPANRVARWSGSQWSALGAGFNNIVRCFAEFDDQNGGGPALYAGGYFTMSGGQATTFIAKWDGSQWNPVGTGANNWIDAMAVYDDGSGSGPALFVAGGFTMAGGQSALRIAKWTGSQWVSLGSTMNYETAALAAYDDGSGGGPALYVGGRFESAGGQLANRIAALRACSSSPCAPADLNCDGVVDVFDLLILLGAWGPCAGEQPGADGSCAADLTGDGVVDVFDLLSLLGSWG
jgi:trimeric autotransporter adhesin